MKATNPTQAQTIEANISDSNEGCEDGYTIVSTLTLGSLLDGKDTEMLRKGSKLASTRKSLSESMLYMNSLERRIHEASLFMQELLDSVETLSGIADEHGSRTLADLFYLHSAILERGHIELIEGDNSKVMDIAKSLPSGSYWANFIETVTL